MGGKMSRFNIILLCFFLTVVFPVNLTITGKQVSFKSELIIFFNKITTRLSSGKYSELIRMYFENYPHSIIYIGESSIEKYVTGNKDNGGKL